MDGSLVTDQLARLGKGVATPKLWLAAIATLIFIVLLALAPTLRLDDGALAAFRALEAIALGIAVLMIIIVGHKYAAARSAFYSRVRWIKAREVQEEFEKIGDDLPLDKLFKLNRKQLDEYHVLSVRQAATAFRNATITSLIAFMVLIAGVILAMRPNQ